MSQIRKLKKKTLNNFVNRDGISEEKKKKFLLSWLIVSKFTRGIFTLKNVCAVNPPLKTGVVLSWIKEKVLNICRDFVHSFHFFYLSSRERKQIDSLVCPLRYVIISSSLESRQ